MEEINRSDGTRIIWTTRKDGKWHGLRRCWDLNGSLKYEHRYLNSGKHGCFRYWYLGTSCPGEARDQLEWEANYRNNKEHGLQKRWYQNGSINYICNYDNGVYHGLYQAWFSNGQLALSVNYVHGQHSGLFRHWNLDGQLVEEKMFK